MNAPPIPVTIAGGIVLIWGALNWLSTFLILIPAVGKSMEANPLPVAAQYGIAETSAVLTILLGILILNGLNWARCLVAHGPG